jgi:hypothetical protein
MRRYAPLSIVAGLLLVHAIVTPALAGSTSVRFTVSATVVAACRTQGGGTVCTKGIAPPRTEPTSVTVSEAVNDGATTVTINY